MAILVFVLAWIAAGVITGKSAIGFVVAILSAIICRQGFRITKLEGLIQKSPVSKDAASVTELSQEAPDQSSSSPTEAAFDAALASVEDAPDALLSEPTLAAYQGPSISQSVSVEEQSADVATPYRPNVMPIPKSKPFSETLEERLGPSVAGFILRGNPIARVGVIILFFGVVFLLKFAVDQGFIPIELRLLASALGAFVLLGVGWKVRARRPQFAITLQGAGAGVFYITTFIAFRLYQFIPGPLAFVFLVAVTALSAALAVLQDARSLVLLAMLGGFLAPVLTSEGGGNHILLFGYFALLNIGIFGICWFKSWRELNLLGFIFTFLLAAAWGIADYEPELYASSQAFLIFFLALFSTINIIFAARSSSGTTPTTDTVMTFGPPFFAVIFQYGLVKDFEYGLAYSSAGFGAYHIVLTRLLFNRFGARLRFLTEAYFSIGLTLLSLAVPFAFSARLTSAIWSLEAVALIWSGIRQNHAITRVGGHILLMLSSVFFLFGIDLHSSDSPFGNPYFMGIVLLTAAHLMASSILSRHQDSTTTGRNADLAKLYLLIGTVCWFSGGYVEVCRHLSYWRHTLADVFPGVVMRATPFWITVSSIFASLSVLLFWMLARIQGLHALRQIWLALMPAHLVLLIAIDMEALTFRQAHVIHPFVSFGFLAWPLLFLVHYFVMRREERDLEQSQLRLPHLLGLWVGTILISWELFWIVSQYLPEASSWSVALLDVVPACILLWLSSAALRAEHWPFKLRGTLYLKGLGVLAFWLFLWPLKLNLSNSGYAAPLPYLPILNPLDLGQALAFVALFAWWKRAGVAGIGRGISAQHASTLVSASLFVWSTALLLRCMHHYAGIRWDADALFESNSVQSALSIYWSVLALLLMLLAHAKGWRPVWKVGAGLVGIVVLKLFTIDLSNHGSVARIAAFLGVGLLMLAIGYFAPIPPEKTTSEIKS